MTHGPQADAAGAFFDEAAEKFGERVGSLVGAKVAFRVRQLLPGGPADVSARIPGKAVAVRIEDETGTIRAAFVFRLEDAILFAATLLLAPKERIEEMRSADGMEQNVADAFAEVANTLFTAAQGMIGDRAGGSGTIRFGGIRTVDPAREDAYRDILPPDIGAGAELSIVFPEHESGPAVFVIGGTPFPVPERAHAPDPGKPSVLYFGRDEAIARAVVGYLQLIGVEAEATADAKRAEERIESGAALILAEFEAGRKPEDEVFCREAVGKGIPLVGVSAHPTRETVLEAKRAGVRAVLVHPFTPDTLREKTAPFLGPAVGG